MYEFRVIMRWFIFRGICSFHDYICSRASCVSTVPHVYKKKAKYGICTTKDDFFYLFIIYDCLMHKYKKCRKKIRIRNSKFMCVK